METTRVTANEFQQGFIALSAKATEEPITITKDGEDVLVLLSADEYARLKRRDRKVWLTEDTPEEWIEAVRNAKVPDEYAYLDEELK